MKFLTNFIENLKRIRTAVAFAKFGQYENAKRTITEVK